MSEITICHLTSVHSRYDIRIFLKQCRSLVINGYKVSLVVADGKGNETNNKVEIVDVGNPTGRLNRIFFVTRRILAQALIIDADLYHLHDPELIPVGLRLKQLGKKVVFDSHEDVPKQILFKPYLNKPLRMIIGRCFAIFESWACRQFDAIVAATPYISEKFSKYHPLSVNINNYPIVDELLFTDSSWASKQPKVCYVGGIASIRGINEMVRAFEYVTSGVRLQLVGRFSESNVEKNVRREKGWSRVDALGWLDRKQVSIVLDKSKAGLVLFHPLPNHIDAQPNKLFEYMSMGLPVIASDFPLWREIVESTDCGICVNPLDSKAIAKAIDTLIVNPKLAQEMGENGRRAVVGKYNWDNEEEKMLGLYRQLLHKN